MKRFRNSIGTSFQENLLVNVCSNPTPRTKLSFSATLFPVILQSPFNMIIALFQPVLAVTGQVQPDSFGSFDDPLIHVERDPGLFSRL